VIYRGIAINTNTTPPPWGATEQTMVQAVLDSVCGQSIQQVVDTNGIKYGSIFSPDLTAAITANTAQVDVVKNIAVDGTNVFSFPGAGVTFTPATPNTGSLDINKTSIYGTQDISILNNALNISAIGGSNTVNITTSGLSSSTNINGTSVNLNSGSTQLAMLPASLSASIAGATGFITLSLQSSTGAISLNAGASGNIALNSTVNIPNNIPIVFNSAPANSYINFNNSVLHLKGFSGVALDNYISGTPGVNAAISVDNSSVVRTLPILSDGNYTNITGGVQFTATSIFTASVTSSVSVDVTKYSTISWRPSANTSAGNLTVTLTNQVQGSTVKVINWDRGTTTAMVVQGVGISSGSTTVPKTFIYDNSSWVLS
jgi:hypothetical protein